MQSSTERIEIPLSKTRLLFLLFSSIAFVGIGIWFATKPEMFKNSLISNRSVVLSIGLLSIGVFGLSTFVIFKKLIDKSPGLIIDKTGITDNSNGIAVRHIPWADIEDFTTTKMFTQKFLTVVMNKPLEQNKKGETTKKDNDKGYGLPISAGSLQYNFNELETLLKQQLKKYKTVSK
ncbi:STM3941 family protein [Emticicia sp. 17c]|uniref:STM3941 family protein n=1 Tax=Emticicia sp. 17c TaxID=3127704 RepID=UPI00301C5656